MNTNKIKIVCCANMPLVKEAFSPLGSVLLKDGRAISADDVRDADLLVIRSTTRVNRELLEKSTVRFVGTATIGTDHMDQAYLDSKGITWMYSAGCNANSVSEYVTAALLKTACRSSLRLEGMTIGIIGVGNVGSLVAKKAQALGLNVLLNDPPRKRAQTAGIDKSSDVFTGLDELLARSDILTFHVPFTREGPDATLHMADSRFFAKAKKGCIFINSARGPVVDTDALMQAIKDSTVAHSIIDTWEGEPGIRTDILSMADIATPHIAGYSFEGKVMGTIMVYNAACRFLNVEPSFDYEPLLPPPSVPLIKVNCAGHRDDEVLNDIVSRVYDIELDDAALRSGSAGNMAVHFDTLRKKYRVRREFRFTKVQAEGAAPSLLAKISSLGFNLEKTTDRRL